MIPSLLNKLIQGLGKVKKLGIDYILIQAELKQLYDIELNLTFKECTMDTKQIVKEYIRQLEEVSQSNLELLKTM